MNLADTRFMRIPDFNDFLLARRRLRERLAPTPLLSYPALDELTGVRVLIKHENLQPIGAFKVRGGLTLLSTMNESDRARGVVTYSTGNHAQSMAYAARAFGVPCVISMPANPNPVKAAAVRRLGAELITEGADLEGAREHAEAIASQRGMRLVSAANEPDLIAGVATTYVELCETAPGLDAVIVPVGSGTGAAAACLTIATMNPTCQVIAVQSSASPAAHDSWREGHCVRRPNKTVAEGLATGEGFTLPQEILRDRLTDFLLVDDAEIQQAQWRLMSVARTVAEGAGAAAMAALWKSREQLAGRKVAIICSGGNASQSELRDCLTSAAM
ncbi:Pyridoxal-5'-phosphate-dependent protein beta subunit [Stackebrandtia nassauensis DSM 44728]|uniref:threonine ammonia-lyase n=2 Tax=Stackebrandtia TaxID=283810 RepID=D3QAK5_STANL|nr:Pyridoxal-5'-phosphate-dependent protein beta subunit [Stackebrandtia nassauensis DSM 44728]